MQTSYFQATSVTNSWHPFPCPRIRAKIVPTPVVSLPQETSNLRMNKYVMFTANSKQLASAKSGSPNRLGCLHAAIFGADSVWFNDPGRLLRRRENTTYFQNLHFQVFLLTIICTRICWCRKLPNVLCSTFVKNKILWPHFIYFYFVIIICT